MKPTLLVYGNCQAGAVCSILGSDPALAAAYTVRYLPSFDDRVPGSRDLDPELVARSAVLLEQFDPNPFPYRDRLPSDCGTVVFPSIDLNLLWPLRCVNPYNDKPTEQFPWGHFPEADRVVIDCVQQGMSADETLTYYRAHAHERLPNLDRYVQMERERLRAREAKCEVRMSDVVFDGFQSDNLFWCANHPTMPPLRELCRRLLDAAGSRLPGSEAADIDATVAMLPPQGPLGFLRVPIHPAIVEHFGLQWYRANDGKSYGLRESPLTYDEYLREMASRAILMKDQVPA